MEDVRKISKSAISPHLAPLDEITPMVQEDGMHEGAPVPKRPKVETQALATDEKGEKLFERKSAATQRKVRKEELETSYLHTCRSSSSTPEVSFSCDGPTIEARDYEDDETAHVEEQVDFKKYEAYQHRPNVLDIPISSVPVPVYNRDPVETGSVTDMIHDDMIDNDWTEYRNVWEGMPQVSPTHFDARGNIDSRRDECFAPSAPKLDIDFDQRSAKGMEKKSLTLYQMLGLRDPIGTNVALNSEADKVISGNLEAFSQHRENGSGQLSDFSNFTSHFTTEQISRDSERSTPGVVTESMVSRKGWRS